MIGIAESVPKTKMKVEIEDLSEQSEREQVLIRMGSALNLADDYEIPIIDSQNESFSRGVINEHLSK